MSCVVASASSPVSIRNVQAFRMTLTAVMEPRTLWRRIKCFPSPKRRVALHTYLLYVAPSMEWRIRSIRTTCVLHSSQGLPLCRSHSHNALRCRSLAPAMYHIKPLCYCYILDAALSPYMSSFEMCSLITIQSSLQIHRLPLHMLHHYRILQVWNILSNLHTL